MRASQLFTKTRKENPSDESSRNAELLIRAGYVDKLHAGVYSYLPLGLKVLKRLEQVIRNKMNDIGGQEVSMPALQPKTIWETTGRWDSMDNLYKISDSEGRMFALGPTHEEVVVPLVQSHVSSYKDLPKSVYQFQTKFRMEMRAKAGLLRGREFVMKDMYSFHRDEDDLQKYYETVKNAYREIFDAIGIADKTFLTFASGGSFSKYSHEFQTVTDAGEDIIYICEGCKDAVNREIFNDGMVCPTCGEHKFDKKRGIEVANIFNLGTRFTDAFHYTYREDDGSEHQVLMGCYGMGLSRLIGAVVEVLSDKEGLVWPDAIAPYDIYLIGIGVHADDLYDSLRKAGKSVLYDDRDVSPGVKFADADLLGIPYRVVLSEKSMKDGATEWKERKTGKVRYEKMAP